MPRPKTDMSDASVRARHLAKLIEPLARRMAESGWYLGHGSLRFTRGGYGVSVSWTPEEIGLCKTGPEDVAESKARTAVLLDKE